MTPTEEFKRTITAASNCLYYQSHDPPPKTQYGAATQEHPLERQHGSGRRALMPPIRNTNRHPATGAGTRTPALPE